MTYDVYYTGLRYLQRLTHGFFTDPDSARELIPEIIEHSKSEIGYEIDDPYCYKVLANDIYRLKSMTYLTQDFGPNNRLRKLEDIVGSNIERLTPQQKACVLHFCTFSLINSKLPNMQIDTRIFPPVGQKIGAILEDCNSHELVAIMQGILEYSNSDEFE